MRISIDGRQAVAGHERDEQFTMQITDRIRQNDHAAARLIP
jgi:hypothetical protein